MAARKKQQNRGVAKQTPELIVTRKLSRAARLYRTQRYHVRANFLGRMNWLCPCCGHINHTRLMQRHYYVTCSKCRASYIPKISLLLMPGGGRKKIPPDFILPDAKGDETVTEAFPVGDMGYWKIGGCVHEMHVVKGDQDGED